MKRITSFIFILALALLITRPLVLFCYGVFSSSKNGDSFSFVLHWQSKKKGTSKVFEQRIILDKCDENILKIQHFHFFLIDQKNKLSSFIFFLSLILSFTSCLAHRFYLVKYAFLYDRYLALSVLRI